jgi:hypothetical protein
MRCFAVYQQKEEPAMPNKLKVLVMSSGCCSGGTCPTIYRADDGNFVVQGYALTNDYDGEINLPDGESAVIVPPEIIQALRAELNRTD